MFKLEIQDNTNEIVNKIPISLRLKQEILDKIAEFYREEVEQNLKQGIDYQGNAVAPKISGGRIFYKEGVLFDSVLKQVEAIEATIFISPVRSQVAYYVQEGLMKGGVPRRFFGPTKGASQKTETLFENTSYEETYIMP